MGLLFTALIGTAQSSIGVSLNSLINLNTETSVMLDDGQVYEYELQSEGLNNTYSIGLSHMTNLGENFYFHKELLFTKQTRNFTVNSFSDNVGSGTAQVSKTVVQMPIAAGVNAHNFLIGAGPVINLNASQERSESLNEMLNIRENKLSYGFQFQLGYQITNKLTVLGKYMTSFDGATDGFYYRNEPVKIKGQQKTLSLGLNYNL